MNSTHKSKERFFVLCKIHSDVYPMVVKFPSSIEFEICLAICVLSGIILLTTVALNSLTALTFWRTPKLRKNVSLFLVMVLSLVDTGSGIFCYPTLTIMVIFNLMLVKKCWFVHVVGTLFQLSSVLSLSVVSAISIERYFGVIHPLIHRRKVSKGALFLLLLGIWSILVLVLLVALLLDMPFETFATVNLPLLVVVTVYAQIRIAYVVIHSKLKRERLAEGQDVEKNKRKNKLHFLKEVKKQNPVLS